MTIDPERLRRVLRGYPHLDDLIKIAEVGIDVQWRQGPMKNHPPPKNNGSCRRYLRAVIRSIREGQDSGHPLGAVVKKGVDPNEEVRTIHDLSFSKNDSVNSALVADSIPKVRYKSVAIIARRIEYLATCGCTERIMMLMFSVWQPLSRS
ncbi:uncharacterized protein PITG_21371 [Phytophthora infestans T30-4]|uniref:Uncharacterized protein n=1 Tax=Phytophthora infestans (strain T30-4) TaxID=403677 RepID=D0P3R9_PHYIT|nr:uncharacterized protein PITG_21371 [Phytophthora infestans T30-4]EEY60728.1 conserved hypothetical protein [Phytophthora infestans T30-4]|eukprot:XP_002895056.1 conserved hypothetical protein [Phytophthora infestans T30-4]